MIQPTEHKSVQARILQYAEEIGWGILSRSEAERKRGFLAEGEDARVRARAGSLYFYDVLFQKVKEFNPRYMEDPAELLERFKLLKTNIYGNQDFLGFLREQATFYYAPEKRELNLKLIDYNNPGNNIYHVTEEFYYFNGHHGVREDVVFLINGIPVLVIECKNAMKDEAIAIGIDQIRRYHRETPELFVPQQLFTSTESIGFSYGATWNLIRRNIFNWKHEEIGNLENKIKTFCSTENILDYLREFIIFAEKDDELNKFILRQHQKTAVQKVVQRCHSPQKMRGLVWHTQGSGKTFTMIKAAEMLFKAPESDKPTILLLLDRNELEDQMKKNLKALGLSNVKPASNIQKLNQLLKEDYRGIIVCMMHKFRDMPEAINTRSNIYVLIDEAHRTTGGDLGNFLMAGLPNATYIGFTGTPVDKTAYGRGTFKTFGIDDKQGYLHKYPISESIEDGTTLPLFYQIAPNELLVPKDILEEEFLKLSDQYGMTDIAELNKILERAVNTKNFLKGKSRIAKVAKYVAEHYNENVEPLGYKAFLVGVDRPACVAYKKALDQYLPAEYSEVVYTGNNNDSAELQAYHLDPRREKEIRKQFIRFGENPKILIVTEKLLTGYDAPILYAMYLDKPMRDHTLLQAISRVNRPYENEQQQMVKPHGFVLDFVGIFENLEKALAFDSDEVNAIVKDLNLLKQLFQKKMETKVPDYLLLVKSGFTDKDTDNIIEHFRDKERRKELFKEYKEIEMLYEIISPDKFLRPYLDHYGTLSAIYAIVRKAYARNVYVDCEFLAKTNDLVRSKIDSTEIGFENEFVQIDKDTIDKIKDKNNDSPTRVINLVMSIEKIAEEKSDDPFLVGLKERAEKVQTQYEERQITTQEAIAELLKELDKEGERKNEQAKKGFDGLSFFVFRTLLNAGITESDAETTSVKIREAFFEYPNWQKSESELRELRKKVSFAIFNIENDMNEVTLLVEKLFQLIGKAY